MSNLKVSRILILLGAVATPLHADERPNIVYIMADELGYYELSAMGHPHLRTPRIDRMSREGLRFTQALAGSSLCAPTRGVLMTGKHSGHTSIRTNKFSCENLVREEIAHPFRFQDKWDHRVAIFESFQLFFIKRIFPFLTKEGEKAISFEELF